MNIRPRGSIVVVKRDPPPSMSGPIHIPETAQAFRGTYGTVLRCGPNCIDTKVGDRVLLPELGGMEFRDESDQLVGLWDEDMIFAVV